MIISASYKTDIPAFYGEWFANRLAAGYCKMRNPFNRKTIIVPLSRTEVDGFVFWTKNFRPFMRYIDSVRIHGAPFTVQYTINGYPTALERNVVDWEKSVSTAQEVASKFGKRVIVWRYDTIIVSQQTPIAFHLENFERIARGLSGATDEVVISFLQLYRKTALNLKQMADETGNLWRDPSLQEKRELAKELHQIASRFNMNLTICSQPELISIQEPSRCIDSIRLSDVAGYEIISKTKGNRPGCECSQSRDIGDYDTCPHGCIYCYAVRNQSLAIRRFKEHDPKSEYLFDDGDTNDDTQSQLNLF
ncbi:MAG: DUF1848 domain-containing protein [Fimbriimonadaceae bacterium]